MRRFSLYRRGRFWYAQLFNPETRKYTSGRSTGESSRNSAALVVADWLRDGIPEPWSSHRRQVGEALHVDTILNTIRSTSLTAKDAERVVSALKNRDLIESVVMKAGPSAVGIIAFLEHGGPLIHPPTCERSWHMGTASGAGTATT